MHIHMLQCKVRLSEYVWLGDAIYTSTLRFKPAPNIIFIYL